MAKKKSKKQPTPKEPKPKVVSSLLHWEDGFLKKYWLPSVILFLFPMLLYFQSISFGYVLDDKIVITDNAYTQEGFGGLWKLFSTESMEGYFKEQKNLVQGGRYRPLSLMTFAIEDGIIQDNPHISHILNILMYGICGVLIMFLLTRLYPIKEHWYLSIPFLVAMVYIAHPIHTEAVANIKGRDEIMATIFGLLSLLFAIKYVVKKPSLIYLALCGLMYYLGILSKENIITFLGAMPLFFIAFHRGDSKKKWMVFGTILIVTVLYLIQRTAIIGYLINTTPINDVMNNPFVGMTGTERFATVLHTMLRYLQLSIVPYPLTHDYYPYHIGKMSFGDWSVWLSLIIYIGLSVYALLQIKKKPYGSYAWLFYVGTLLIVSNLIFNVGTFMNERFAFISSLGIVWLMILCVHWLTQKWKLSKWLPLIIGGLLTIVYSFITLQRVPVWENAMTLNRAAIKVSKNSARANSFMSTALFEDAKLINNDRDRKKSMLLEAEGYAKKAIEIIPNYSNANLMLAGISAELYKFDSNTSKLLNTFQEILPRNPGNTFVPQYLEFLHDNYQNQVADCYAKIADKLRSQGDYQWALHHLAVAMKMSPNHPQLRFVTAATYRAMGDEAKARQFD